MVSIVQLSTCFGFVFPMIMGFSNTGQVMIDALAGQLKDDVNQIIKLENFRETLIEETKKICQSENRNNVYIYQVDDIAIKPEEAVLGLKFNQILYHDDKSVNLTKDMIFDGCEIKEYKQVEQISMQDIFNERKSDEDLVIVQVLPSFKSKGSLENIKEQVYDLYNDDDIVIQKRGNEQEQEEEDAVIEEEIEHDFEEAESLASEETDPVNILANSNKDKQSNNGTTIKHDNLFTKYQFFTSGIWSGIIVSLFLLTILYGALSWLTSLEITYASFEKQVDYDKKNE